MIRASNDDLVTVAVDDGVRLWKVGSRELVRWLGVAQKDRVAWPEVALDGAVGGVSVVLGVLFAG